jgi:hypothetical protein
MTIPPLVSNTRKLLEEIRKLNNNKLLIIETDYITIEIVLSLFLNIRFKDVNLIIYLWQYYPKSKKYFNLNMLISNLHLFKKNQIDLIFNNELLMKCEEQLLILI